MGYWNTRAICEPIRLLLHYCEITYKNDVYTVGPPPLYSKEGWFSVKQTLGLSVPNLPYYIDEESGVKLTQMHAIMSYIADKYNEQYHLYGKTAEARATHMMLADGLRDWIYSFFEVTYCNAPWLPKRDPAVHHVEESEGDDNSSNGQTLQCSIDLSVAKTFYVKRAEYLAAGGIMEKHLTIYEDILRKHSSDQSGSTSDLPDVWITGKEMSYVDFILAEYLSQHLLFSPRCLEKYPLLQSLHRRFYSLPRIAEYVNTKEVQDRPLHNRYSHFHTGWPAAAHLADSKQ